MAIPQWATALRPKGTEIKEIKGNYYLYERKSRWDPARGKAKKVTGAYIGKVTPEGIVPKRIRVDRSAPVFSLEVGATSLALALTADVLEALRCHFGSPLAERIYATAMARLVAECPFCQVADRYETSWLSRELPGLALSPSSMTGLLDEIGSDRSACAAFMRQTMGTSPYLLIDGTRTPSASAGTLRALPGHAKDNRYLPQLNQVYVMAITEGGFGTPAFYRNVAGNVPDVTALKLTLKDAGATDATFIADTGFASQDNFKALAQAHLGYIVPLRRNTSEVELGSLTYSEAFTYHHRTIRAASHIKDDHRICVFRDERLRAEEMCDFIERIEKDNAAKAAKKSFDLSRESLRDAAAEADAEDAEFGTIVIRTSITDMAPQKIYGLYKMRWQIELMFDTLHNTLGNDASYMHDDAGFEAWSFIGHIALMAACRVLALLKAKGLSKQWSLRGIMGQLSRVHAVTVADEWMVAETTKKTRELIAKLGFELPQQVPYSPKQ